jgi:hypothetical protein
VAAVLAQERGACAHFLSQGVSPADAIYRIAKNWGYTPAAPTPPPAATPPGKTNGNGTVPPETTLARLSGEAPGAEQYEETEGTDMIALAQAERFGKRKA